MLSRGKALALGVSSAVNLLLALTGMALYMTGTLGMMAWAFDVALGNGGLGFGAFGVGLGFILLTNFAHFVLLVIYLVVAVKLGMESNEQVLWIVVLLFAGAIGQLAFLYMKLWPRAEVAAVAAG